MTWQLFTTEQVIALHDVILNPGELTGLAGDKSLDGALTRVAFRINYGFVTDVYDLAAMYAVAISQAHAFNDANKRTGYAAMKLCLKVHGAPVVLPTQEAGDTIIAVAQGQIDEVALADWLRQQ